MCVYEGATEEQKNALLNVWSGKLGGPITNMAGLVGEMVTVEQVPITFEVQVVNETIKVGDGII